MVFHPWMWGLFSHVPPLRSLWYLWVEFCENLVSGEEKWESWEPFSSSVGGVCQTGRCSSSINLVVWFWLPKNT